MKSVSILVILAWAASASELIFINNCSVELALYSSLQAQALATIQSHITLRMDLVPVSNVTFWTNLNGGQVDGKNALKVSIGLQDPDQASNLLKYQVLKPVDKRIGVGFSINFVTKTDPQKYDCVNITCNSFECDTKDATKDKDKDNAKQVRSSPIYTCGIPDTSCVTIFCPSGKYPRRFSVHRIRTSGDREKCLDVRDGDLKEGNALVVKDCNDSKTQQWIIDGGRTQIRLANSQMCLEREADGDSVRLKTCAQGHDLQRWIFDRIGRIGIGVVDVQLDRCLDARHGVKVVTCKTRDEKSQIFSV